MTKRKVSPEEIQQLYNPDTFYNYGDNPALKKLMEITVENNREGKMMDYRTPVTEKYRKIFLARNWDDVLQRDLKCITFPRAFAVLVSTTMVGLIAGKWTKLLLPLGENGITKLSQTQFYHLYGPLATGCVLIMPIAALYVWYKTAKFTAKKFYHHVILGERNWLFEASRQNSSYGEYYFKDALLSHDEAFPDLARGQMTVKKWEQPELTKIK